MLKLCVALVIVLGGILFIQPQKAYAAPVISSWGRAAGWDPWVLYINGTGLGTPGNPSDVIFFYTSTDWNPYGYGTGIAYAANGSGTQLTLSFPSTSNMPPNGCNYTGPCTIYFVVWNNGSLSERKSLTLPQYPGYNCNRCSSNYGCTNSVFKSTDTACTNVIPGTSVTYTAVPEGTGAGQCPRLNPPPQGGHNNNCPAPTNTPTPTPQTCNRCSANYGCAMATFQSNDGCNNALPGTTPAYTTVPEGTGAGQCPRVTPPFQPGGNNDRCAINCSRCSNNFGCQRANFQTLDACPGGTSETAQPFGAVTYTVDASCGAVNPLPADGDNNSCGLVSCSRCSNIKGCQRATFQTRDACPGGESQTASPVGTVTYVNDASCLPVAGDTNTACPTENAPTVNFTIDDTSTTSKTINSGGTVTLRWSSTGATSCSVPVTTANWTGGSRATSGSMLTQSLTNADVSTLPYRFYINCSNSGGSTPTSVVVNVLPQGSGDGGGSSRPASFEQTSGIIFSGNSNSLYSVNSGKTSERSWVVNTIGATADKIHYKSPTLITSYNYLLSAQGQTKQLGQSFQTINCGTASNNCNAITSSGVYHVTDNDINSHKTYTFNTQNIAAGQKVVVLVNGSVILSNPITVANGGLFILAAKDNIVVSRTLGQTGYSCSPTAQLEGIFSAQGNFEVEGNGTIATNICETGNKDKMLNIAGTVITNADLTNQGRFKNSRDLCEDNLEFPAVSIRQRPDFIVNLPEFAKRQKVIFKEIKP